MILNIMERVYLVEDGPGYGERAILAILSLLADRNTVYLIEGLSSLSKDIGINKGSLLGYIRSLENKGYIKVGRRRLPSRVFTADIELKLKNGKWIRVPRSFLFTGNPKERGLLLTLTQKAKNYKLASNVRIKKTAFYLKNLLSSDIRTTTTLRRLLKSLQSKGFILIERTRPFYVVRVVM